MKSVFSNIVLSLLSILLGSSVSVVLSGFLHFIEWGQHILWKVLGTDLPFQSVVICTLGGLFVGLCQRYLGDYPKPMNEAVAEIKKTKRLDYSHLPQGLVTVSCSLVFGASLGPEAAIVSLVGGLSTWVGDAIVTLRKWLNLALPAQVTTRFTNLLRDWPNLLALLAGAVALPHLLGGLYSGGFLNLHDPFHWRDLLWSIPMGLLGAMGGFLFLAIHRWMKKQFGPIQHMPVLRGVLSGFILGLIARWLPMMLFSGQHDLQHVYEQAAQLGFWMLILIALARFFLVNLLLANGWKGGQFLPIMLSSAALGLAMIVLLPSIPASAAILGTMAALVVVVLPNPILVVILMAIMFPIQYVGLSAVSVGTVMAGKGLLRKFAVQRLTGKSASLNDDERNCPPRSIAL